MKKAIHSVFAWMLAAGIICDICNAATVDVNSAQTVATNFYSSNSDNVITSTSLAYTETASDGAPAYYVFNINTNDGFVIVTADDAALPIIGYATTGHYNAGTVVPPLVMWLKNRTQEISFIKSHNLPATQRIKEQWQAYQTMQNNDNVRSGSVGPLCTTLWNQYTNLCPAGDPSGCTATAMAQIMKFWNYPPHGIGSLSYDDTTSLGFTENDGIQSANFANTTYDWAAMPNSPLSNSNNAIDTLMYQCAVSVYTDFNFLGSSANMIPYDSLAWKDPYGGKVCAQAAYSQYFGYDSASMQGLQKTAYTDEAWDSILEGELNKNRPLQYGGYTDETKTAGHTWVCDGYEANAMFHMNWGWGGSADGYYGVDALNAGGYELNTYDEVLIGIQPASLTGIKEISLENQVNVFPNPTNGKVTIYSPVVAVADIQVYNMIGEDVLQLSNQPINKSTFDLSSQPAGLYFIRFQGRDGMVGTKVIKE